MPRTRRLHFHTARVQTQELNLRGKEIADLKAIVAMATPILSGATGTYDQQVLAATIAQLPTDEMVPVRKADLEELRAEVAAYRQRDLNDLYGEKSEPMHETPVEADADAVVVSFGDPYDDDYLLEDYDLTVYLLEDYDQTV